MPLLNGVALLASLLALDAPPPPEARRPAKWATIHACTRFTTRYEAPHLLPWLAFHRRVGVDHFHLYFHARTADLSVRAEAQLLAAVAALPEARVTIYNTTALGLDADTNIDRNTMQHCTSVVAVAGRADPAVWGTVRRAGNPGATFIPRRCSPIPAIAQ